MDHNAPFGLKPSSGMQGEVADATIDIWFSMAIGPAKKWVDDFVLFRYPLGWAEHTRDNNDPEYQYQYDLASAKQAIAPLGIPWHASKGQDFDFDFPYLGYWWSLPRRCVTLTDKKCLRYKDRVNEFLATHSSQKPCSKLAAMKINGSLSWVTFVYPEGRVYLTNLCKFISGF